MAVTALNWSKWTANHPFTLSALILLTAPIAYISSVIIAWLLILLNLWTLAFSVYLPAINRKIKTFVRGPIRISDIWSRWRIALIKRAAADATYDDERNVVEDQNNGRQLKPNGSKHDIKGPSTPDTTQGSVSASASARRSTGSVSNHSNKAAAFTSGGSSSAKGEKTKAWPPATRVPVVHQDGEVAFEDFDSMRDDTESDTA